MEKFTESEINEHLSMLDKWCYVNGALERNFEFRDFQEAFAFLTRTALYSEKVNHHAEYTGVYNKLSIRLNTHDVGGVSQKDIDFAKEINSYFN